MGVEIRAGRPEDIPVIEVVAGQEELDARGARPEEYVVAEDQGRMIGFGRLLQHADCWEIACMYVAPDYRRRGVGKRIVQQLLDTVADERTVYVAAGVPGFFTGLGFVPVRQYPESIQDKRDYCNRQFKDQVSIMRYDPAAGRRPVRG